MHRMAAPAKTGADPAGASRRRPSGASRSTVPRPGQSSPSDQRDEDDDEDRLERDDRRSWLRATETMPTRLRTVTTAMATMRIRSHGGTAGTAALM